jgi:hypothetical protein
MAQVKRELLHAVPAFPDARQSMSIEDAHAIAAHPRLDLIPKQFVDEARRVIALGRRFTVITL